MINLSLKVLTFYTFKKHTKLIGNGRMAEKNWKVGWDKGLDKKMGIYL